MKALTKTVKVENMNSPKSGYPVANQYRIWTADGVYFQSYRTLIAFAPYIGKKVLDINDWDYSRTTMKYLNEFLGHNVAETRKRIKSGEYKLEDLNQ